MALEQRFRLFRPPGAFAAEWVCADEACTGDGTAGTGVMTLEEGDEEGGLTMVHAPACKYGGSQVQTAPTGAA